MSTFLDIAKYDFFPTDQFLDDPVFGEFKKTDPQYAALGYESHALF
jgi:hypothetical protein